MDNQFLKEFRDKISADNLEKLSALNNPEVIGFITEYIKLCNPKAVFVRSDSPQDARYVREKAVDSGEEMKLSLPGHTVHFDGYFDQGRDKKNTKYLLPEGMSHAHYLNSIDREAGGSEVKGYLRNIMKDKEMIICFFCLGPVDSDFSLPALQITDSFYVVHSEDILYRSGYEEFKKNKNKKFFGFVHSAGELAGGVSKNIDKKRMYIDLQENIVYSVNTQYAGNTVGLKKLALRLAINKASQEDWLAEHMFIMGIKSKTGEKKYFCGAYPSMCGKTSTAMLEGESIVGDDLAYLKARDGKVFAANVERGIFGIIHDVNSKDDKVLFRALTNQGEVIFSNILVDESKRPFWIGKDARLPHQGINFSGDWFPGKTDEEGEEIPASHKNARYTIGLSALANADENLDNPQGVLVSGFIYGGRDSDISVPVEESFSWNHGIITKAAGLESETTAATLGQEGVRVFNPMSNIDFLSVPLGEYIRMNLEFGEKLEETPLIFSVNYFLRDSQGRFFNEVQDKHAWLKWMRLRVSREVGALITPTGLIPKYEDLKTLFDEVLGKRYSKEDYIQQFTIKIPENLAKIERITNIYKEQENVPEVLFGELKTQEQRLNEFRGKFGDYISPELLKEKND